MHRKSLVLLLCFAIRICLSNDENLVRQKRLIYFPVGGTFKFVIGFGIPIKLAIKQSWAWGWNMQWQYPEPQTTNDTRYSPPIVAGKRRKRQENQAIMSDRAAFYAGIEAILSRNGSDGRSCLLLDICSNAMNNLDHEANGLYGHLMHIALTPDLDGDGISDPYLDPIYLEAQKAGEFGVDCTTLYPGCRQGQGLLEQISAIDFY